MSARVERLFTWSESRLRENLAVDLRALALMRVAFGLVVIIDLINRSADIRSHYSDLGWLPRALAVDPLLLRAYFWGGSPDYVAALMLLTGLLALMVCLGVGSRVAAFGCWFLLGSLHQRNWLVEQGGDDLLRNMLLVLALTPLGARWSVDRWIAKRRGRPSPPTRLFDATTWLLYGQLFLVYFVTGTLKANYAHWWRGEAVYQALSAAELVTEIGEWIYPHWYVLKVFTWGSLLLELVGPVALVLGPPTARFRGALALTFMAFHIGIALTIHVGIFSLVAAACWLFVVPSAWLDRMEDRFTPRADSASRNETPDDEAPRRLSARPLQATALLLIVYLFSATAIADVLPTESEARRAALWPATTLGLKLHWALFISNRHDMGWMVVRGILDDGREVDILRDRAPLSYERPEHFYREFDNQRWRKVMARFRMPKNTDYTQLYLHWLCMNQADLQGVSYVRMYQALGPRYDHGKPVAEELAARDCRLDRATPAGGR